VTTRLRKPVQGAPLTPPGEAADGDELEDAIDGKVEEENPFDKYVKLARRKIRSNVFLAVCTTAAEIEDELRRHPFILDASSMDMHTTDVLFVWDQAFAGEAQTSPHLGIPPFQYSTCNHYVTAALKARSKMEGDQSTQRQDVFIFAAGWKHRLVPRFQRTLTDGPGKTTNRLVCTGRRKRILTVGYEQESLQQRRRIKCGSLPQIENVVIIGPGIHNLKNKRRRYFHDASNTTKGTLLAPVVVPGYEEGWCMPFKEKIELLGDFRIRVGGANEVESDVDEEEDEVPPSISEIAWRGQKRKSCDEGTEPAFYHNLKSRHLWVELNDTQHEGGGQFQRGRRLLAGGLC